MNMPTYIYETPDDWGDVSYCTERAAKAIIKSVNKVFSNKVSFSDLIVWSQADFGNPKSNEYGKNGDRRTICEKFERIPSERGYFKMR